MAVKNLDAKLLKRHRHPFTYVNDQFLTLRCSAWVGATRCRPQLKIDKGYGGRISRD